MSSIINMVTSMKTKWACAVAVGGLADVSVFGATAPFVGQSPHHMLENCTHCALVVE